MEVRNIEMVDIRVSEYNIKKDLDAGTEDTGLKDLTDSIKAGLETPRNPIGYSPLSRSLMDNRLKVKAGGTENGVIY